MSKRFWDDARAQSIEGGFGVSLDGRTLRLPSGAILRLAGAALAEAVAAEWQAAGGSKGGTFGPEDVKLTGLAGAVQERVAPDPAAVARQLAVYAGSDVLCHRAGSPDSLRRRQDKEWQPWLDWAARTHGVALAVGTGVMPVDQPPASLAAAEAALTGLAIPALAALGVIVPALGSCVLGLAVAGGALDAAEAMRIGSLEELWSEENWGTDAQASARRAQIGADVEVAAQFMAISSRP